MSTQKTQNAKVSEQLFADTNISMKSGNLVKDAEVIADGKFVKLRIASNKQYRDQNNEVKTNTNYFNALVSVNLSEAFETAESLQKGDWVYLKGEDASKSVDTAEGYKETSTTLFAYKVVLKKQKQDAAANDEPSTPAQN